MAAPGLTYDELLTTADTAQPGFSLRGFTVDTRDESGQVVTLTVSKAGNVWTVNLLRGTVGMRLVTVYDDTGTEWDWSGPPGGTDTVSPEWYGS